MSPLHENAELIGFRKHVSEPYARPSLPPSSPLPAATAYAAAADSTTPDADSRDKTPLASGVEVPFVELLSARAVEIAAAAAAGRQGPGGEGRR